jgi:hypothetical protein
MKYLLIALFLAGCAPSNSAPDPSHERVSCKGTMTEQSKWQTTMTCDDGRVFVYTTQKYPFYRNGVWQ